MANTREIQGRMKSIKDTMKITNAMYMVSSSKLQKARGNLKRVEPYFNSMQEALAKILDIAPETGGEFFDRREGKINRRVAYLLITADKGLAGSYNHNVIKEAERLMAQNENSLLFIIGQVGKHYFEARGAHIEESFNYTAQNPTVHSARKIANTFVDMFKQGEIDEVHVIYTKVRNSMTFTPERTRLLPLSREKLEIENADNRYETAEFLPSEGEMFEIIVPSYITGFIYGALVESYCSEHNSRMIAMQTATDAAGDMIKELDIQFNRARQAAITQEITEVAAGAKAQKLT